MSVAPGDASATTEATQPLLQRVVLLTRESDTTTLVANFLAERFDEVTTVVEIPNPASVWRDAGRSESAGSKSEVSSLSSSS